MMCESPLQMSNIPRASFIDVSILTGIASVKIGQMQPLAAPSLRVLSDEIDSKPGLLECLTL